MRACVCAVMGWLAASAGCTKYRVADADGGDASSAREADGGDASAAREADGGDASSAREAGPDTFVSDGPTGIGGAGGISGMGGTAAGGTSGTGGVTGLGGSGAGGQVNTQSDGKNCGSIGHDCLGGQCLAGQCQPVLIAQYLRDPLSLAIGSNVVCEMANGGLIGCAHKDASDLQPFAYPSETAMALFQAPPSIDGNRLVFAQLITAGGFQLSICDIGNCEASAQALGGLYTQYSTVDSAAHRVYWIDGSMIFSSSTSGTPQPVQLMFDSGGATLGAPILYTRSGILFTSLAANGSTIHRIPISATGASTRAVLVGSGQAIAANDQFVFSDDADGIRSIPLPNGIGGGSNLVLAGVTGARLAADQTTLYWTASPGVATCTIADCAATRRQLPPGPSTAMDAPFSTVDVAVDDTSIFWLATTIAQPQAGQTITSAKIFRLAK